MQIKNIREYKIKLREKFKAIRFGYSPEQKAKLDNDIIERLMRTYQYKNTSTILCYVSTPLEVDTRLLIKRALEEGKRVAVPRCKPETTTMDFYLINSFDDLEKGTFGVLEPIPSRGEIYNESDGICIVPGLCFDHAGYRLGYGKGYYDRFLTNYSQTKIGICYNDCVQQRLFHGRYDVPVDLLITEKYLRITNR